MSESTCPRCGAAANGNFCASCGASLASRACASCGAANEPGARFCTTCGTPVAAAAGAAAGAGAAPAGRSAPTPGAAPAPKLGARAAASKAEGGGGGSQFGWWMAGTMLVFLLAVVAYPVLVPQESRLENPGPTGGALSEIQQFGNAQNVDLSSMSPTDAANRLFDRVMRLFESGDTTQVQFFLPMSISAYEQAEPLDADGLYHLSTLHRLADQPDQALAASQRILDVAPTHLFGLYEQAEAHLALGDTAQAGEFFQAVLDNWDDEQAAARPAYQMHPAVMPTIRQTAEDFAND